MVFRAGNQRVHPVGLMGTALEAMRLCSVICGEINFHIPLC